MEPKPYPENDSGYHATRIKSMLNDVASHAREDISKIDDPRAKALFETTAEVLLGSRGVTNISSSAASRHGARSPKRTRVRTTAKR